MSKKVHIKQLLRENDAFLSATDRIYDFFLKNRKKVIYGAVALVLIAIIVAISLSLRASFREESSAAYYAAMSDNPEENIANMEKIREEWKGYPVERLAAFSMVESYKNLGKITEARDLLRNLALRPAKSEESLSVLIHSYLGALSEEIEDYEEALSNYQKAKTLAETRAKGPGGETVSNYAIMDQVAAPFISNLLLGIGRANLSLGNKDAAKEAYAELTRKYPDTAGSYLAGLKIREIENPLPLSPPEPEEALSSASLESGAGEEAVVIEEEDIDEAPAAGDETQNATEAAEGDETAEEDKTTDDKAADDKSAEGKDKKD